MKVSRMLEDEAGMSDSGELNEVKQRRAKSVQLMQVGYIRHEIGVSRQLVMHKKRRLQASGMRQIGAACRPIDPSWRTRLLGNATATSPWSGCRLCSGVRAGRVHMG